VPTVAFVSVSFLTCPISTHETFSSDSECSDDMISLNSPSIFMSLRRTSRANVGYPPDCYDFPHDIVQIISYSNISPAHTTFIVSFDSIFIPKC
jgi:hypothetical protein